MSRYEELLEIGRRLSPEDRLSRLQSLCGNDQVQALFAEIESRKEECYEQCHPIIGRNSGWDYRHQPHLIGAAAALENLKVYLGQVMDGELVDDQDGNL